MSFTKVALAASVVVSVACSRGPNPPPPKIAKGGLEELSINSRVAEVPANAKFRVIMNDALSSTTSYPGQTFTATLVTPLMSNDARMAAPTGSRVNGHVVSVQTEPEPRIAVAFDTIDTPGGLQRIEAHAAHSFDAPFRIASMSEAKEVEADGLLYPSGGAIGGGPLPEGVEPGQTTTVIVPKSAQMELVLVSPLTVVLPER